MIKKVLSIVAVIAAVLFLYIAYKLIQVAAIGLFVWLIVYLEGD